MKKKNMIIFLSMIFISFFMCIGFVRGHYSTDDYNIMNMGMNKYSYEKFLIEGRPVSFLLGQMFLKSNIDFYSFNIFTVVFAIVLTVINIILVYQLLKKYYKDKDHLLLLCVLFFTIFNFMYIENLYYFESIIMALSLVFYTLSAKYFFKSEKYSLLKSLLFNVLAIFCYNAFECYFIILISILSLMKNDKIGKKVILDILKAGLMIIVTIIINWIQIKIVCGILHIASTRIQGFSFKNILIILYNIPRILFETSYLFPKYLLIISLLLVLSLSCFYDKKTSKLFLENLFLIGVCIFSSLCISIFSLSSFMTGRISYGVGMTIGIVLLRFLGQMKYKKNILKIIMVIYIVIYSCINVCNYCFKTSESRKMNQIEKKEVLLLDKDIKKYEINNHIEVNQVVCLLSGDGRKASVIDMNALRAEWSATGVINYYTNRNLEKISITKEEADAYKKRMDSKGYYLDSNRIIIEVYDW